MAASDQESQADPEQTRPTVGRPPGPSPRVRTAVLAAVAAELIEHGFAGLNVERVATRAGVARGTVYAHWPDRRALVLAATSEWHISRLDIEHEGIWPADLRHLCLSIAKGFAQPSSKALMRTIMATAEAEKELHHDLQNLFVTESSHLHEPIQRAKEQGQIRSDLDPHDVLLLIAGPLFMRCVFNDQRADEHLIDFLVESVLIATAPTPTPND